MLATKVKRERERELCHVLCNLFITKAVDKLLSEMLCEVAHSLEDALPGSAWQDSCQSLLPAIVTRRSGHSRQPLDCDVIKQLRSLQSGSFIRIAKRLNRASRALQLGLHAGDDKTECLESKRVPFLAGGHSQVPTLIAFQLMPRGLVGSIGWLQSLASLRSRFAPLQALWCSSGRCVVCCSDV